MTDGYTKEGAWIVSLDMTADQVAMLIRAIEAAVLSSGSGMDSKGNPQIPLVQMAYQQFLADIIKVMRDALEEQKP